MSVASCYNDQPMYLSGYDEQPTIRWLKWGDQVVEVVRDRNKVVLFEHPNFPPLVVFRMPLVDAQPVQPTLRWSNWYFNNHKFQTEVLTVEMRKHHIANQVYWVRSNIRGRTTSPCTPQIASSTKWREYDNLSIEEASSPRAAEFHRSLNRAGEWGFPWCITQPRTGRRRSCGGGCTNKMLKGRVSAHAKTSVLVPS